MKHLHKAPPAAQKQLLQLLIKSITFMEDKVELRMYIDPIDKIDLPILQNAPTAPKNTKGPADPSQDAPVNTETSGLTSGALTADGDCLSNCAHPDTWVTKYTGDMGNTFLIITARRTSYAVESECCHG
jgi:hypothetical protein